MLVTKLARRMLRRMVALATLMDTVNAAIAGGPFATGP